MCIVQGYKLRGLLAQLRVNVSSHGVRPLVQLGCGITAIFLLGDVLKGSGRPYLGLKTKLLHLFTRTGHGDVVHVRGARVVPIGNGSRGVRVVVRADRIESVQVAARCKFLIPLQIRVSSRRCCEHRWWIAVHADDTSLWDARVWKWNESALQVLIRCAPLASKIHS